MAERFEPRHQLCVIADLQRLGYALVLAQQALRFAQALRSRLEDGVAGSELRLLRNVGKAQLGGTPSHAVIDVHLSSHDTQQAGLARAVAPDQRNFVAGVQRQLDVVQQGHVSVGERDGFEGQQGHGRFGESGAAVRRWRGGRRV